MWEIRYTEHGREIVAPWDPTGENFLDSLDRFDSEFIVKKIAVWLWNNLKSILLCTESSARSWLFWVWDPVIHPFDSIDFEVPKNMLYATSDWRINQFLWQTRYNAEISNNYKWPVFPNKIVTWWLIKKFRQWFGTLLCLNISTRWIEKNYMNYGIWDFMIIDVEAFGGKWPGHWEMASVTLLIPPEILTKFNSELRNVINRLS